MNESRLSADDPRLTAYALGELEDPGRAVVEEAVAADPALRAAVEDLRATARRLESALAAEPGPVASSVAMPPAPRARFLRFPAAYFLISGLAAACFALVMALREPRMRIVPTPAPRQYVVLPLAPPPVDDADGEQAAATGAAVPGTPADSGLKTSVASRSASITVTTRQALASRGALDTEAHGPRADNRFIAVASEPRSTFPIDVDTAGYANVRRFLQDGRLPPREAVHIEELVNYFPYRYTAPADRLPFAATLEVAAAPWDPKHRLVRIGLKGREETRAGAVIAEDVKIQVEFNPARAKAYRLIGYENRPLKKDDTSDPKTDPRGTGAGHAVTALYEVIPTGADETPPVAPMDELKYRGTANGTQGPADVRNELLTVSIQYNEPAGDQGKKLEFPLTDGGAGFAAASGDFKFAAAVAGFGLALREEPVKASLLADATRWAGAGLGEDPGGYRAEFISLARRAQSLAQ
jgi:anti-sigma factor RsiW